MPPDTSVHIVAADDAQWQEFTHLTQRAYGHPVPDVTDLRPHADARVGIRAGRVIAGGLGLLIPHYFGGRPVPAASIACGCVAPEARGQHVNVDMATARLRALHEQGAVVATAWSTSTGYAHRLGWAAPAQVLSWTVPTEQLRRSFSDTRYEITYGPNRHTTLLQRDLAAQWNGTWQRPDWWEGWQYNHHPDLASYGFQQPGNEPTGVLSLAVESQPAGGRCVVVHDFWAATDGAAAAMFAFLGRHHSRIPTVAFERTGLPPAPILLHHLNRAGSMTARAWHPWMLRVLDLGQAVRLRGWSDDVDLALPLEIVTDAGDGTDRFNLTISAGDGELRPCTVEGRVTLTRPQFAVWYAGGYRTATAAALAGVRGDPPALAQLVRATTEREPWLADYF